MKPFVVGLGRGGCRIANLFLTSERPCSGMLLDTEDSDVKYFQHKYKLLIGEKLTDGNGTGGDLALGREILEAEKHMVVERMDSIKGEMDCILVVAALGGGTGGAVDVLGEELRRNFTEPVYCIGVMPSDEDTSRATVNFSDCFKSVVSQFHALFPVDNDALKEGRRLRTWYNHTNKKIYEHFARLFQVGEYKVKEAGGNVISPGDVINTMSGLSTIGVGNHSIKEERSGIFAKQHDEASKPELVVSLTEKAIKSTLFPLEISDVKKALVMVSGPKKYMDFMGSIPARLWLEKNIGGIEIRGGDVLMDKNSLEVVVVLSGIKKSKRIKFLYQMGKMLKHRKTNSERLSSVFEKITTMESNISDLGVDFKAVYDEMRNIVKEPAFEEDTEANKPPG